MKYVFACGHCNGQFTLRRPIDEMDDPVESRCCGAQATRLFVPTSNIHIPIHFRQVLSDGSPGGGNTRWDDIHDVSLRELAHLKDENGQPIEVMPYNRALSQPGAGLSKRSKAEKKAEAVSAEIDKTYREVRQWAEATGAIA